MLIADSCLCQRVRLRHVTSRVFSLWNIKSQVESKSNRQQADKFWEGTVQFWSSAKLCGRFGKES